jgi:glycylpeptide N-tetradecanoyltransferase
LFGFIAGIPVHVNLNGKKVKMAEINFLCVHRDLRAKRLAPVLIKEITRRVNLHDVWQAIYTAGVTIPTPVTNATYWHRILNPNKCLDFRFSGLPAKTTRARYLKLQKLPELRPMIKKDVPIVHELLSKHLCQNKIHMTFTQQEVEYYFLPREGVINSYVIEDAHTITDFYSFYSLPSKILKHETEKILYVAYSYYNISTTNRLKDGMEDMLILARDLKYDVFNALDLMENTKFLETLKFGPGDGTLHYYLYNWRVGGDQEVMP